MHSVKCPACGKIRITRSNRGFRCCNSQFDVETYKIASHTVKSGKIMDNISKSAKNGKKIGQKPDVTEKAKEPQLVPVKENSDEEVILEDEREPRFDKKGQLILDDK